MESVRQERDELQKQLQNKPDYQAVRDKQSLLATRDRVLNKLKMGRQSMAGKAIDAFLKEMERGTN